MSQLTFRPAGAGFLKIIVAAERGIDLMTTLLTQQAGGGR